MLCPYCKSGQNRVKGKKEWLEDSNADARVRECCECGNEFLCVEQITCLMHSDGTRTVGWKPIKT